MHDVRRATPPDAAAIAAINAEGPPAEGLDYEPRSVADVADFDAVFDRRGLHLARWVAGDPVVGYAHVFQLPWSVDPRRFWVGVRVARAHRGAGVGSALREAVAAALAAHGADDVWTMVREEHASILAGLASDGFVEVFRSGDFLLDVASAPVVPVPASGVELRSLAELLAAGVDVLPALHQLYGATNADVPLPDGLEPDKPYDAFVAYLTEGEAALPEGCVIAREGDRVLGMCALHRSLLPGPPRIDHHFTGVAPAARGRGLARLLKLWTIDFARRAGFAQIATGVESNNEAMVAINARLGFVRTGGLVVLRRRGSAPGPGVSPPTV